MKILPAIVLLLWAVCYGRCFADQYGVLEFSAEQKCVHQCCGHDEPKIPVPDPVSSCEVCEFIRSGTTLLTEPLLPNPAAFICLAVLETRWLTLLEAALAEREEMRVAAVDTGPPIAVRLCEWMASTAMPVRGPNAGA